MSKTTTTKKVETVKAEPETLKFKIVKNTTPIPLRRQQAPLPQMRRRPPQKLQAPPSTAMSNVIVQSYKTKDPVVMKNTVKEFVTRNSAFKATQLTACNNINPTVDDILCNLKFQYKIQSFI